jgi:hypothetical protein
MGRENRSTSIDQLLTGELELATGKIGLGDIVLPTVQSELLPAVQSELLPALQAWLDEVVPTDELVVELHNRMEEMQDDVSPLISDNEELLDQLRGLLPPGDPVLGVRFENMDTDNDGLSDVAEIELGLDPFGSNDDGFIELIEPEDGASFERGVDRHISFRFEPLDTDADVRYTLILESGGQQFTRNNVSEIIDLEIEQLINQEGGFDDSDGDGEVEVEWFVEGRYQLQAGVPVRFSSERRSFTIQSPPQQSVIIDLSNESAFQRIGGDIIIHGTISEVSALGEWEIQVAFDSSVLQFEGGRKLGIFSPATVFFGEQAGGVVTISGSAPRGSGGISGDGAIFALRFTALAADDTVVEGDEAALTDTAGQEIDTEFGTEADVSISGGGAASFDKGSPGAFDGRR